MIVLFPWRDLPDDVACEPPVNRSSRLVRIWKHVQETTNAMRPQPDPENYETLSGTDAVEKLKEIVQHQSICMFHTGLGADHCETRPMAVQDVNALGHLWLFSARGSKKNADIANDPRMMLTIAEPSRSQFLVVHGEAVIVDDRDKKKELWNNLAKAWFPKGVEDPELTLLKVQPTTCYYWDTLDGRLVSLLKIATAAVTGNMNDSGSVEGALTV